jgi:CheY-like chemotaxis protein
VLAAEDNLVNQMVLRTFLEPTGIVPIMVENGREALDAWEKENWDLVLMDIQMPEMNGVEAAKVIRSRERETGRARTPIIAVTASAMTHQLEEFAAVGMDGVVPKPVNMASLLRMIEQAVPDRAA